MQSKINSNGINEFTAFDSAEFLWCFFKNRNVFIVSNIFFFIFDFTSSLDMHYALNVCSVFISFYRCTKVLKCQEVKEYFLLFSCVISKCTTNIISLWLSPNGLLLFLSTLVMRWKEKIVKLKISWKLLDRWFVYWSCLFYFIL